MTESERNQQNTNETLDLAEQVRLELFEISKRLVNIAERLAVPKGPKDSNG